MILVTGGTGTSGKPIVEALLDRGASVRVLARDPVKAEALLPPEVEIARGDFSDPQSLAAAMEDVDRALLLSPPSNQLVAMDRGFVDVAQQSGVRHIVKFSAMLASPDAPEGFTRWHGISEAYLKQSRLNWTMLRPPFFMQNLLGLAGMIKTGTIYQPAGKGKAGFVDVRDIAAVAASALTEEGHAKKAYDITGAQLLGFEDIAAVLSRVLGRTISYVDISPDAAKQSMVQSGMPEWQADGVNVLFAELRAGRFARITAAVNTIGHKDPIRMETFVQQHAAEFS